MAENVSWIKKPNTILSRRTMHMKDLVDVNSTLNMLSSNQDMPARPPKRKSCMMFKERKIVQVPSEKKVKPNVGGPTEFKNRTLTMVHGPRHSIARPGALRTKSQLPGPKPVLKVIKTSPLHMSTPCEPPRSILKANTKDIILSVSKRVNFDQVEPGVFPLQESTIQDFTQFDFKKQAAVLKVDASTNTDDISMPTNEKSEKDIFAILIELRKDILSIKNKVDGMEAKIDFSKNACSCKVSFNSLNTPNQTDQFMYKLDNIDEDNESETHEDSSQTKESTEKQFEIPKEEIKSVSVAFSKLSDVQEESCSSTENTIYKKSEKENIPENVDAVTEEPLVHPTIFNLMETEESVSTEGVTSSDTEHKKRTSKLQVSSPVRQKLRILRKRNIPRHLQSFELSPKNKRSLKE